MIFRRALFLIGLILASCIVWAQEYIGISMQGKLIGFSTSSTVDETVAGKPMKKQTSRTFMDTGLLGAAVVITIDSVTWLDSAGKPTLMKFNQVSAGRSNKVEANFLAGETLLTIDNSGSISRKRLPTPKDAPIVDDALNALLQQTNAIGASRKFYVLDPVSASFVLNTVTVKGPTKFKFDGEERDATLIEVAEPRMVMKVFLSSKGDFLKAEALGALEMRPITESIAKEIESGKNRGATDLAEATRMEVSPPLGDPASYSRVSYDFSGGDFSRAPTGASQWIRKSDSGWRVTVEPVVPNVTKATTISKSAAQQKAWTAPGLNIPSEDPAMRKLARDIVGKETNVVGASRKISAWVEKQMVPNAGIGVLRNAKEILSTKEGVCRDYAILNATLLRAAQIPARLASGLVYQQGAFYYHAWVEIWDGARWVGFDATRPNLDVTPGHVKLAQGSVEDAFLFTFLDRVNVKVVASTMKEGAKR